MTSGPIEITEDFLFAKIGRLTLEVEALRAMLAQALEESSSDDASDKQATSA